MSGYTEFGGGGGGNPLLDPGLPSELGFKMSQIMTVGGKHFSKNIFACKINIVA